MQTSAEIQMAVDEPQAFLPENVQIMNTLDAAKEYVSMGFSLIPISRNSKKPIIEWKKYQTEYPTTADLEEWFPNDKNMLAIVTGKISNLTVVDIDYDETEGKDGYKTISEFFDLTIKAPRARTPRGGSHVYFRHSGQRNKTGFIKDCDIRGEGGYVVAPPSSNGDGKGYTWKNSFKKFDIPDMPKKLATYLKNMKKEPTATEGTITKGIRDDSLFKCALKLAGTGMAENEVRAYIATMAKGCTPPFPFDEAMEKVRSAFSYAEDKIDITKGLVNLSAFYETSIPEQPMILSPWLKEGTIGLLTAPRGVGKTWFSLSVAMACGREGVHIGDWVTENPVDVLYIDGEMPAKELQERTFELSKTLEPPVKEMILLSTDYNTKRKMGIPNFAKQGWRDATLDLLQDRPEIKLVVVDNIASLMPGIDENSKQEWDNINQWLLHIRHMDRAVLVVHHAGKSGDQRGTSGREDNIDISITLKHPAGYVNTDGAKFEVAFTKSRGIYGNNVTPFVMQIIEQDGGLTWTTNETGKDTALLVPAMLGKGVPKKDIHTLIGITRQYVTKLRTRAIRAGNLDEKNCFTDKGKEIYGHIDIDKYL